MIRRDHEFLNAMSRGYAHDWGDALPVVGDEVEDTGSFGDCAGQTGKVVEAYLNASRDATIVRVQWGGQETPRVWFLWRMRPVGPPFNPALVKMTRGGHPVANLELVDGDRPIKAEVFVGRQWMTFTYLADGHFIGRHDQPIDLVEAK